MATSLDIPLIVVNGYAPLVLKQIKEIICEHRGEERCILVHSIDGLSLRGPKAVVSLVEEAADRNTHIIASMDHINTPLCMSCSAHINLYNLSI